MDPQTSAQPAPNEQPAENPAVPSRPLRAHLPIAAALFFLSGALGLGYELLWIKKAALLVGASQSALSAVLTSFFLGLALGSRTAGARLYTRRVSPLVVYALFEAGIGAFALAFPFLFRIVEAAYAALYPAFAASSALLVLLRFLLLFVLFLPPTFLMGGTLPLLVDGLVARDEAVGRKTGLLYGINVLGAVLGVLLTSELAIPQLGLHRTVTFAGLGNLALGLIALVAFRGAAPPALGPSAASAKAPPFFTIASFASGFVAIGYQIAWARYFSLFNKASVHLTASLLAVYLLAVALGSLLVSPLLAGRHKPLTLLALFAPLVPVFAALCLGAQRHAAYVFTPRAPAGAVDTYEVVPSFHLLGEALDGTLVAPLLQVGLVLFLPTLLLGTGLPILIAAATSSRDALRAVTGRLLFWNTVGSSLGGGLTGYLLIPAFGLKGCFVALAVGSCALALAAAWQAAEGASGLRRLQRPIAALPLLAFVASLWLLRGDVTVRTLLDAHAAYLTRGDRLIEVVEGPLLTAYVLDGEAQRTIHAGDVSLANADYRRPSVQAIQGHLPALFHPGPGAPKAALGICLGSGQSFGAMLMYPIETLDVVDISEEMIRTSLRHFGDFNHHLASDPRVTFHLDDGRHFLARARPGSYDVVSMEPPPPGAEGVYALYSIEFYRELDRALREGGIFMQWLPLYFVTPLDARAIIRTQSEVFPNTFLFRTSATDFMVLSFKGAPPLFSIAELQRRLPVFESERLVKGALSEPGCHFPLASLEGALSLIVAGPEDLRRFDDAPLLHDDDQRLGYGLGDRGLYRRYNGPRLARLSFAALPVTPFARLAHYFDQPIPAAELDAERARALASFQVVDPAVLSDAEARFASTSDPRGRADIALGLAFAWDQSLRKDLALRWVGEALAADAGIAQKEYLDVGRAIAKHAVAAYSARMGAQIAELEQRYPQSPLLEAMALELYRHEQREHGDGAGR